MSLRAWKGGEEMSEIFSSSDLLRLGYEQDELLLEDMSLCALCTSTCSLTAITPPPQNPPTPNTIISV
jgi:hypothetical protein